MPQSSVLDLFHRSEVSDRVALINGPAQYTYGETAAAIDRVAAGLWALGVRRGDRIGIYVREAPHLFHLTFAVWRLGAMTVFVDAFEAPQVAISWWNDTSVKCVVIDENYMEATAPRLAELAPGKLIVSTGSQVAVPGVLPWSTLDGDHPAPPAVAVEESDELVVIRSSGTTGRPKGICHSLHNLNARLRSHLQFPPLSPDDLVSSMARMTTVMGLNAVALPALAVGARILLLTKLTATSTLEEIVERGATTLMFAPAVVHQMTELARARPELARTRLRFAMSGGDKLSVPVRRAWDETFGVPLLDGFGYSETLAGVLMNRLGDTDHADTVGYAFPEVELRLVDEEGRDVPDGEEGELWVKADFMFTRYLDEPERTSAALVDGWFRTGDYLTRDAAGCYRSIGRRDFRIIRHTLNVSPGELESVILDDAGIAECMVAGFPNPAVGQDIEAFLVLREPRTLDQIKDRVVNRVGPIMCPSQFWTVTEIPRNARGKVDRTKAEQLRARATPLT